MFCIHCDKALPDSAKFCYSCGQPQISGVSGVGAADPSLTKGRLLTVGAPSKVSPPPTSPRTCPRCKLVIPPEMVICDCGYNLLTRSMSAAPVVPVSKRRPPRESPSRQQVGFLPAVLGVGALTGLVILAGALFSKGGGPSVPQAAAITPSSSPTMVATELSIVGKWKANLDLYVVVSFYPDGTYQQVVPSWAGTSYTGQWRSIANGVIRVDKYSSGPSQNREEVHSIVRWQLNDDGSILSAIEERGSLVIPWTYTRVN